LWSHIQMHIKVNYRVPEIVVNRSDIDSADVKVRKRMHKTEKLPRKYIPDSKRIFIFRTISSLVIRGGRQIVCDYDITHEDVIDGCHFDDDT
jgi:hypothetical protein